MRFVIGVVNLKKRILIVKKKKKNSQTDDSRYDLVGTPLAIRYSTVYL